uniref:Plastocyanin-like domain-containing protein n=1 Tax=Acrobeloides nanus TaxID=290746 RepID=A0A914CIJ1_9BILA
MNTHYDGNVNGWVFEHASGIPYFHENNLQDVAKICDYSKCPPQQVTGHSHLEGCHCFHYLSISLGSIVQITIYNMGFGGGFAYGFAHPMHIHGNHFYVMKMGFPVYNNTNLYLTHNPDIACNESDNCNEKTWTNPNWLYGHIPGMNTRNPSLRDTITVPMGGYIVIRFRATNPGWWYAHCHLQNHDMAGMAFVLKIGNHSQMSAPPPTFPKDCGIFEAPPLNFQKFEEFFGNGINI